LDLLTRDGVRVAYEVAGSGPTVLFSHGFAATSSMWREQVAAVTGAGYRAIVWDQRGHGRSDAPDDPEAYSEETAVADMAAVLDACGAGRVALVGLSLGGYLSLAFHLAHPARVAALVLCDTGPGYTRDDARDSWNRLADRTARAYEERGLVAAGSSAEVREARHRSARGLALAARGVLAQRDARVISSLPTVGAPTLVIVGADDAPFLAGSEYMAARIPGARLAVLEGAGHASNIDQPEAFNRELLAFLAEVEW
jgi:pimeloyl-ACP methyl ester carboxylesterase